MLLRLTALNNNKKYSLKSKIQNYNKVYMINCEINKCLVKSSTSNMRRL